LGGTRAEYEAEVRALAFHAERLRNEGVSLDQIARDCVQRRNQLKARYRFGLPKSVIASLESRNLLRYGDPLGPTADSLLRKYGSWEAVISASCRHLDLNQSGNVIMFPKKE
jgi:hypothetical protein